MTDNDRCTNVDKYVGEIKGGLRPTMKIIIMGMINPSPKRTGWQESSSLPDSSNDLKQWFSTCDLRMLGVRKGFKKYYDLKLEYSPGWFVAMVCGHRSFSVTLLCDPKDDHTTRDIGLLLVVSFSEKSIVRNSQIAGKWGKEEKTIPYFPFTAEDSFKMELLCEHQQIRILLDGRQLCSFSHRVQPVQRMTVLQISGDLKLTKVA